jgi:hypothetical protein
MMKKCCANCKFYHDQGIGNVCRLDFNFVKSTDCCDEYVSCFEEDNLWKKIKYITTIVLILTGINSVFADFVLQREVAKLTDNFWIIFGSGFVFLCPILNLIFIAIRDLNKVEK